MPPDEKQGDEAGSVCRQRPTSPEGWMTADAVAVYLSLSRKEVYRLAKAGELPVSHLGPRRLRFHRRSIDATLRSATRARVA